MPPIQQITESLKAKIATRRHIVVPQIKIDTVRLKHAATDFILHRIVSEHSKMPGSTARRNPGRDRIGET